MKRSTLVIGILGLGIAAVVGAESLQDRALGIDSPSIGARITLESPLDLGRSQIALQAGTSVREMRCGDLRCGLLILGGLKFSHRVDDPFSQPVARRNFRTALGEKVSEKGSFTFEKNLEEAVIWGWGFSELPSDSSSPTASLPAWVDEILRDPLFERPSVSLLQTQHVPDSGLVLGLLKDGKEYFVISHDPWESRTEGLWLLEEIKWSGSVARGRHFPYEIVSQPLNRAWWDNTYGEMVSLDTHIEVDNDREEHLSIQSEILAEATKKVRFWKATLRGALIHENKTVPHNVIRVEVDGKAAPYLHVGSSLLVDLGRELVPGNQARITVESEGNLAIRYGGDRFWSLGTWSWYPSPDWNGELSTFKLRVRSPEKTLPFASGSTVKREVVEGFNVLETRLEQAHQIPIVAAGAYSVYEDTKGDQTCRVATYAFGKEKAAKRLIKNCFAAINYYQQLFGLPFPHPELTFVERNDWGWAQAPPGIVFITHEAFDSVGTIENRIFSQSINNRIVHEIAHSYWGHVAKMVSSDEQWISESFADYSAALCLEAMKGGGKKGKKEFEKEVRGWKSRVAGMSEGSVYLANRLAGKTETDSEMRIKLLYGKGPLVLHHLRLELQQKFGSEDRGDEIFYTWMRSILQNFSFRFAETKHLIGILNQITQDDWQPYFERYIYGSEMPDLKKL